MTDDSPRRLEFRRNGAGLTYLRGGWWDAEDGFVWTRGTSATIQLPDGDPAVAIRCELALNPFIHPPFLRAQPLRVTLGGQELFRQDVAPGGGAAFVIPAGAPRPLLLTLHCPGAIAPVAVGAGGDVRTIAFAVSGLTLARAEGTTATARPAVPPPQPAEPSVPAPRPLAAPAVAPKGTRPRLAAITMVYNEREYLPLWLRHYGRQVGLENCYVVDHGSDDGSTAAIAPANLVRIPRSPYDPHKQSAFNSDFCSSLLHWYDRIIYSDVDELVMPDPRVTPTLVDYCMRDLPDIVNAIGLNSLHIAEHEADIDLTRPISEQRPYVFINSSMCKPLLTRRPVLWSPGSHSADAPVFFDHLYLFHLRWFDLGLGLKRLQRTRSMAWARQDAGKHQRVEDDKMRQTYASFGRLTKMDGVEFDPNAAPVGDFLDRVLQSQKGRENDIYRIDLDLWPNALWRLPPRFVGTF